MKSRKLIGLITAVPESLHVQRVLEGVFEQGNKYDYNIAVFSPMSHLSSGYQIYTKGEINIYELINYEMLDGVIVDAISLIENNEYTIMDNLLESLKEKCNKPVVFLNLEQGNYPVVKSSDEVVFREILGHVIDVHHKKKICIMTGFQGHAIAEERLRMCLDYLKERQMEILPEWAVYGDFWYTSGAALGEKLLNGEIAMPEAVVCTSDHMAIGLVNYLTEHGIKVPQDIIVTGFEASQEAALNTISVTSFESNQVKVAADGLDILRKLIEPEKEIMPMDVGQRKFIHSGMSCGCEPDFIHTVKAFKESFYFLNRDFSKKIESDNDIGRLMEGYVAEIFAEAETPQECLRHIFLNTYFLLPYDRYYLCLKENWLDPDHIITKGYPEKIKMVVYSTSQAYTGFYEDQDAVTFDTSLMLPQLYEDSDEPSVFYFSPVHFGEVMLGYSVIQKSLVEQKKINVVYRTWLRNVNVSLEMIRSKNRLMQLSVLDEMTGAYNRRGMDANLSQMLENAQEGDSLLVAVVDMDGLKYVNDTFGHSEGDFGIKQVHKALLKTAGVNEICVRAGGDEFYLFGVGQYTQEDIDSHIRDFYTALDNANQTHNKPYLIGASIGMELEPINENLKVDRVINVADVKMYTSKVERKKQRL